jgi:hypothetical protein
MAAAADPVVHRYRYSLRSHQQRRDGTRADVVVYGLLAGELAVAKR